jgi:Tetratricopeptide repeat
LNRLASLACQQKRHTEAEQYYRRALFIQECHQPGHPETARSLLGLAEISVQQGSLAQAEPLLQRACTILEQSVGTAHPEARKAVETHQLVVERRKRLETLSEDQQDLKTVQRKADSQDSLIPMRVLEGPTTAYDPLQDFLATCCELHPRAWSRVSALWQAYEQWVADTQERFPLSRRAFATHLKAHGCRPDRTSIARIWRGITLVNTRPMTTHDNP